MVTKTIRINIPDWLYRLRPSNLKKFIHHKFFPQRCSCCGTPVINPYGGEYSHKGASVIYYGDKILCRLCILNKVATHDPDLSRLNEYQISNRCDVCGQNEPSVQFYYFNDGSERNRIHYLAGSSWNSGKVCKKCTMDIFQRGVEKFGCMVKYNGQWVGSVNGMPVVDGKIKLPQK